jgi:DNA-directed RNA polymerase alpha subunit
MPFDDLSRPLTDLEVAVVTSSFFAEQGWVTLGDLCRFTATEVLERMQASPLFAKRPQDPPKSLNECKDILAGLGLQLGMDVDAEPTLIGKP